MDLDPHFLGPQQETPSDAAYAGSRYATLRRALFASAYYRTWGSPESPPLPVYDVTLRRALRGVGPMAGPWRFQQAARRSVRSRADWRPGEDGRGFRRILHPNGVCLFGSWEIDPEADVPCTGYFRPGSHALVIGRYSTCCSETRGGRLRSLSLVGKLFPTTDEAHPTPLRTANFITQEDIGGSRTTSIDQVKLRNAPDTTPWQRGAGLPILLVTGVVLLRADAEPTIRQVYPIAELGEPEGGPTRSPEFMQLICEKADPPTGGFGVDFRDEVLGRIYDPGDPVPRRTLDFHIEVSDRGFRVGRLLEKRCISGWKRIGRIVFREAVASYAGDFLLHFQHPAWRRRRDDPASLARRGGA
jgi:hypothetical protein